MENNIRDYLIGPWRLRATYQEDVFNTEDDTYMNVWVWYVSHKDENHWMAHGITDVATDEAAQAMYNSIDGGLMDVYITYLGETWEIIEPIPVAHAQTMRDMVRIIRPERLEQMLGMTHAEIRAIREAEENDVDSNPSYRPNG